MKIAVVGSRSITNSDKVISLLDKIHKSDNLKIITGGARGVDSIAIEWCRKNNIDYKVVKPIEFANKLDYLFRNVEIITMADRILAIWDGESRGTKFVIDYSASRNKPIYLVDIREGWKWKNI